MSKIALRAKQAALRVETREIPPEAQRAIAEGLEAGRRLRSERNHGWWWRVCLWRERRAKLAHRRWEQRRWKAERGR